MMRSWLIAAPDALGRDSVVSSAADRLVIDLAGGSRGDEQRTRQTMIDFLQTASTAAISKNLCVRIHSFASGHAEADISAIVPHGIKIVVLPQAIDGATVQQLDVCLSVAEARAGITAGQTRIMGMSADTPSGFLQAASFAGKSRRLAGLGWDAGCLAQAIGATRQLTDNDTWSGPMAMARSTLLMTAADCGVPPIDTISQPCPPEIFERICREARADGFVGKMTRDLGELEIINAVFGSEAARIKQRYP